MKAYLEEKQNLVERALQQAVQPAMPQAQVIFDAMEYSLLAGGKRLRPILFLMVLEAFGKQSEAYLPFACGLEMIHTYSLIHDDLPAMDNDDLRRGKPTCHKAYGEDYAILAGDGLLTHSFVQMLSLASQLPASEHGRLLAACQEVALAAGLQGMLVGQVLDLAAEKQTQNGQTVGLEQLSLVHSHKTGALFRCAIVSAAQLAGANEKEQKALTAYAQQFGLAFQIVDDILDVIGTEAELGKPVGSDVKNQKTTYVTLLGLAQAKAAAQQAIQAALSALEPLGSKGEALKELAVYLLDRKY